MELFVYGTLKRGWGLAHLLDAQRFIGEARTDPCYQLVNLGSYPGLVRRQEGGVSVHGELWDVTPECLAELDEVEGVSEGLYERVRASLLPPHANGQAEVYLYLGSIANCPDCGDRW